MLSSQTTAEIAAERPVAPVAVRSRRALRKAKRGSLAFALIGLCLAVLLVAVFFFRIMVSIEAGTAGVLYRFFYGTETGRVFQPGLHIVQPWNTMVRYEMRKQTINHSFTVLSNRGLPVEINLTVRYQPDPEQVGLLHREIGPEYPRRVVLPQVESVLRRELSSHSAEDIYTNAGGFLSEALRLARDEVGRNFVIADDIVIRSIALPAPVKAAIEDKLAQKELLNTYTFVLQTAAREAERLRIEGTGLRDYNARLDETLTQRFLEYESLRATEALVTSEGARVLIVGGEDGLPFPIAPDPPPAPEEAAANGTPDETTADTAAAPQ
ncbi:MAG: prohibitin family protein [Pseudomonadota bacterium]